MNNIGFIKLQRQLLNWEWYNHIPTKTLFLHLLLKANYKDKLWRNSILIKRGSLITTLDGLCNETKLTIQCIRTSLKNLKSTSEITYTTTRKNHLINIVNYGTYQNNNNQDNTPTNTPTNTQLTHQLTTTKEERRKEEYKKNKQKKEKAVKIDLPDYVESDLWNGLMEIRTAKKAVQTELALNGILKKLRDYYNSGGDPNELLRISIENSWRTVFPPDNNFKQNNKNSTLNEEYINLKKQIRL